jgi:hypothetical protein
VISTDTAGRYDHSTARHFEFTDDIRCAFHSALHVAWLEDITASARHRPIRDNELVHAVPESERDETTRCRFTHEIYERLDESGAGSPGDVKPRNGITWTCRAISSTLGPANDGKKSNTALIQPAPLLAGGKVHVRLGPLSRPVVFIAIEPGSPQPILPGQLD